MATHLIIDGYNLLALIGGGGGRAPLQSEMARESLLRDLAVYRQRKGHAVTVVFDGWQQGQPIDWAPAVPAQAAWLETLAPNAQPVAAAAWKLGAADWKRLVQRLEQSATPHA